MFLFNVWTIFFLLNLLGCFFLDHFGITQIIIESDKTFISFGVLAVYILTSISIGKKYYAFCKTKEFQELGIQWFIRTELAALGLIGTIIGMMLVLGPAFGSIDSTLPSSITDAISIISIGVGTALWTTISALISAVLLGLQLVVLEHAQENI